MFSNLTIKDILAAIGTVSIVLGFMKLLFDVVPKLDDLKNKVLLNITSNKRFKRLEKQAIAGNIENVVNKSVSTLQRELPPGWINKARISWVKDESDTGYREGALILRIRPLEDQDKNLLNGIYYFFRETVFPETKEVIPLIPRRAASLHLARRTISDHHPYALPDFETDFLEPAIQDHETMPFYIDNFNRLDSRGFFTGVYLREISSLAKRLRFSAQRSEISNELTEICQQIALFIQEFPKAPDNLWVRKSANSSYALLLVARPVAWRRVDTYVNKAVEYAADKIERLYVLGANEEKDFVQRSINAITVQTRYELQEIFELYKDYRGKPGGVCAIFSLATEND